ncbi:hypothetical protein KC19_8G013600 [Ceratodon purpureus]|uniref:Uncharacterized protein n=1 Tax=Ceratodon purpureus TaxID=3225 RepID=A0A8T0GXE7_CERPU|nr:hypothetical protein KC19_8G013600 [Ceratodon purpureus]
MHLPPLGICDQLKFFDSPLDSFPCNLTASVCHECALRQSHDRAAIHPVPYAVLWTTFRPHFKHSRMKYSKGSILLSCTDVHIMFSEHGSRCMFLTVVEGSFRTDSKTRLLPVL